MVVLAIGIAVVALFVSLQTRRKHDDFYKKVFDRRLLDDDFLVKTNKMFDEKEKAMK